MSAPATAPFAVGERVVISGLTRATHLNGRAGVVLAEPTGSGRDERCSVSLDADRDALPAEPAGPRYSAPEEAFVECFLSQDDFLQAGLHPTPQLALDDCRTAAALSRRDPATGYARGIAAGPRMFPAWPMALQRYAEFHPERSGRLVLYDEQMRGLQRTLQTMSGAGGAPVRWPDGLPRAARLEGHFFLALVWQSIDMRWAFHHEEGARAFFRHELLARHSEEAGVPGLSPPLRRTPSAELAAAADEHLLLLAPPVPELEGKWPCSVCLANALFRVGRVCAKVHLSIAVVSPFDQAPLGIAAGRACARAAARVRASAAHDVLTAAAPAAAAGGAGAPAAAESAQPAAIVAVRPANLLRRRVASDGPSVSSGIPSSSAEGGAPTARGGQSAAPLDEATPIPMSAARAAGFGAALEQVCASCGGAGAKFCSRCRVVAYCSEACQREDWRAHRELCRARTTSGPRPARSAPVESPFRPEPSAPADFALRYGRAINRLRPVGAQALGAAEAAAGVEALEALVREAAARRDGGEDGPFDEWIALLKARLAVQVTHVHPSRSVELHLEAAATFRALGDEYREGNCYADACFGLAALGEHTRAEAYKVRGLKLMQKAIARQWQQRPRS